MRRFTLFLMLALFAACGDLPEPTGPEAPVVNQNPVAQFQLATTQPGAKSYIVFAEGAPLPRRFDERVAAAGGTLTGLATGIDVAFVTSDSPDFREAMKGFVVIPDVLMRAETPTEAEFSGSPQAGAGVDEPLFALQWGMQAIHAPGAWDEGSTGEGVLVAVLDEGFDLDHPDLEYAPGEISFACWQAPEFVVELSQPPYCEDVEYGTGFDFGPGAFLPILDPFSHATHVSGIISALDNGIGVIGVAPQAHVLPVKVLSEYLGAGFISWILQGVIFATQAGADVINLSLATTVDLSEVPPGQRDEVMRYVVVLYRKVVNYAYRNGATVVVAAGNGGVDADGDGRVWIIPAELERAITVSATGPFGLYYDPEADLDRPASYTNMGKSLVDFAAPGGDYLLFPAPGYQYDMVLSTGAMNAWYWTAGTSMAAPHAAGVAALIIGENGGPMHPARVEAEMRRRAEDLGQPGADDIYGQGRISTGY